MVRHRALKLGLNKQTMTWGGIALGLGAVWYFGINPSTRKWDIVGMLQSTIGGITGGLGGGAMAPMPMAPMPGAVTRCWACCHRSLW